MDFCPKCGFTVASNSQQCPKCGKVSPRGDRGNLVLFMLLGLLLGAVALYAGFGRDIRPAREHVSAQATTAKAEPTKPKVKMETVTRGGEFRSVPECVDELNKVIGPLKISKDKPDEVLGTTREGNLFACTLEETGTRGTYVSGWYMTEEPTTQ